MSHLHVVRMTYERALTSCTITFRLVHSRAATMPIYSKKCENNSALYLKVALRFASLRIISRLSYFFLKKSNIRIMRKNRGHTNSVVFIKKRQMVVKPV